MRILGEPPFDSVRGVFFEGNELYEGAGFLDKTHIQICIRNPNLIRGYFIPRKEVNGHNQSRHYLRWNYVIADVKSYVKQYCLTNCLKSSKNLQKQ